MACTNLFTLPSSDEMSSKINNSYKRNGTTFQLRPVLDIPSSPQSSSSGLDSGDSSRSLSPIQDKLKLEVDETHLVEQLVDKLLDTKLTTNTNNNKSKGKKRDSKLLCLPQSDITVCVYCGINLKDTENSSWDERVCSSCVGALNSRPKEVQDKRKRHALQLKSDNKKDDVCKGCRKPISEGGSIEALGEIWHSDHFNCNHCQSTLTEFVEFEGKPYCERDFHFLFGLTCQRCSLPLLDDYIDALDSKWHLDCFTCTLCPSPNSACYSYQNQLYCEHHYYLTQTHLCSDCNLPIKGQYLTSNSNSNSKYHLHHFNCQSCQSPLNDDTIAPDTTNLTCLTCHQAS